MPVFPVIVATATVVVAASDSLHKERADYVCDGVADNVEIQAAINDLPAAGGKVVLLEGQFNLAGSVTAPSSTIVQGMGWPVTIARATGNFNVLELPAGGSSFQQFHDMQIDGAGFTGDGIRGLGDNGVILVSNVYITRCYRGFVVDGSDHNITILNSHFIDNQLYGVKLGTDCDMRGCYVGGNGEALWAAEWNSCGLLLGWGSRVSDCHFWNNGRYNVLSDWGMACSIVNCIAEGSRYHGIFFLGRARLHRVTSCLFTNNARAAADTYAGICLDADGPGELGEANIFANNVFLTDPGSNLLDYCIEEVAHVGTDWNLFVGNMCRGAYGTAALLVTGANTDAAHNVG